ncbi:phosphoglycerate mutase-like protein [Decorospora gaudefroyi]|uniref:Phosphoglycerate mutase-like protein n=1 Tax=Decorospora gaudefroyi TaxID=184978 RepID=A0A6A5JZY7_9PLEO|nr:phosphoglycerate mutase-like protein [Decorospora gaudefroyi]
MQRLVKLLAASLATTGIAAQEDFNVLQHLGGNGQWFPAPDVTGISSHVPAGCKVDLAAFFSRHGSRYPDTGAYNEWFSLYSRLQGAGNFTVTSEKLEFLKTWKPVLSYPERQIANISPTGWKELYAMGTEWRLRYPDLYEYNSPFTMWANFYKAAPRVRDSARLFAQGFVGPNATELTTIYALNSTDPASWGNSLATSDLCKAYHDTGGSPYTNTWASMYLPPITNRLNARIQGFNFTQSEISIIPYLCGFETQITGRRSPFCNIFTADEILQYEYAQDLRYWYGNGPGTDIEKYQMLPIVEMVAQRFIDGPEATYKTGNGTFVPPKIMAAFSNDGQINQIAAMLGVFDNQQSLPGNKLPPNRLFRSSLICPMRGTIAFERLFCPLIASNTASRSGQSGYNSTSSDAYMRIRINDAVYPVVGCTSGPGSSCPVEQYHSIIGGKLAEAGDFNKLCNVTGFKAEPKANFFMDNALSFQSVIKP